MIRQKKYYYLIHIQYLGYRLHGWAKQPQLKTVHGLIDKTLRFALGHTDFKTLGTSRTDAMVSANHSAFELFLSAPLDDMDAFMVVFNLNLPPDINALRIEQVDASFNIIQSPKVKHYEYLFTYGAKAHPMSAAIMGNIQGSLDIEHMKEGAQRFIGCHHFGTFCTQPKKNTQYHREILISEIIPNTKYTASFFPENSYIYRVSGKGFMRNQVRLMMGQLIALGQHQITLKTLDQMLISRSEQPLTSIAPASGLILDHIEFDHITSIK